MRQTRLLTIVAIAVAAVALIAWLLRSTPESSAEAGQEEEAAAGYPRGPHGSRLLTGDDLQLEVTIYETGVTPHFRVFPLDRATKPVDPKEVQLSIELHRLGGRVERIAFAPEGDYLRGQSDVEEPHSFDVKVSATRSGRSQQWEYSQYEGRAQLEDATLASAGISVQAAGPRTIATTLEVPGEIKADETKLAHVVARLQGVILEVLKKEGDHVRQGELVAVINSRELADAKSAYLAATQQVEFARVSLDREENLWKKKISAEQEYLNARRALDEARLNQDVAAQKLVALDVPVGSLAGLPQAAVGGLSRFEIRAPLSGTVVERDVTVGESVPADRPIFVIADLSSVWVEATVTAKDLNHVYQGQVAAIDSKDLDKEVAGRVAFISALLGDEARSAKARIFIANPDGRWRPGLFVTVRLVESSSTVVVAVPVDAIQTFRDWQVVFVRYGNSFEARPLTLGRSDGQWVEVIAGLAAGERFAATNAFAVKAEIGKRGASHDQ